MILAVTHLEVCNRTPVFLQCTFWSILATAVARIDQNVMQHVVEGGFPNRGGATSDTHMRV